MNKQKNNKKQIETITNTENKMVVAKAGKVESKQMQGIKWYKLPVIKQVSHGYKKYSMGNINP